MSPVRIMELRGTYKGGGGPDKTILYSAVQHPESDFFVLVTYLRDPGDHAFQITEMAEKLGVEHYVEIEDRRMLDFSCLFKLHKLIKRHKIQIIHVHDQKTALLGVLLKCLCPRVQIMNTAHGWIANSHQAKLKQRLHFIMLKMYPLHIAVSEATRRLMIKNGIKAETITTLYNAIDTDQWKKCNTPSTLRDEYMIPQDHMVIGTVGRLSEEKDILTFLEVAAKVLVARPGTRFVIVGDAKHASLVNALKARADELRISEAVIFTGHRTDLTNVYSALDLFLSTSLTEGLPNTLLEAMAMGVPVVATDVGGVAEMISSGTDGVLVTTRDPEGITRQVEALLDDASLAETLARNARQRILDQFSFSLRTKKIEAIYRALAHPCFKAEELATEQVGDVR